MHPAQSGQVQGVATTDGYASSGDGSEYPPFFGGGGSFSSSVWRGGEAMVTSELYQFCLVIIGIIGLVLQAKKK